MSSKRQKLIKRIRNMLAEMDRLEKPGAGAKLLEALQRQARGGKS